MTLLTPIYSWPYPEISDPPNGPAQFQAALIAVENSLNALNTIVVANGATLTAALAAWAAWAPVYTGITAIGNGAVVARYIQIGKTVHARFQLTVGSTTTFTGTTVAVGLPVPANANYVTVGQPMGSLWLLDSSAGLPGRYDGTAVYWNTTPNGSVFFMSSINAAAAHAGGDTVGSTLPFTLAVSDHIAFQITYEAA